MNKYTTRKPGHARDVADEGAYIRREGVYKRVATTTRRKRPFVHSSPTVQGATREREGWMYDTPTTTSGNRLCVKGQQEAKHKSSLRGSQLKLTFENVGQSRFRHLPRVVATASLCAHYSYTLPGRACDVERSGVTIGRCLPVCGFD
jgi:hypothetical protein